MNHLPERQQHEPMPGWPTVDAFEPAARPLAGPVELYEERQAVVYVPGPGGQMVGVYRDLLPAEPVLQQPAIQATDPWPKRIVATGAVSPLVGWGGSLLFNALAGATTALTLLLAALILAKLNSGRSGGNTTINKTTINHNRWFGKSSTKA
jgi:hypothetical protein